MMQMVDPATVGFSPERLARIEPALAHYLEEGRLAGMVTLLSRRGEIVHYQSHGVSDLTTGQPMPLDAIFRIYSMSKPVTAVALLTLYEQARVRLDDPVAAYIPEFGDTPVYAGVASDGSLQLEAQQSPMTVRQLLTHTSGLSYGRSNVEALAQAYAGLDWRAQTSLGDAVRAFAAAPLLYQPGTRWSYSFAIDVIGYLVEVLSGQTLDVYMREHIFEPLDMADSGFTVPECQAGRLAHMYTDDGAGHLQDISEQMPAAGIGILSGGGGLFSTTRDYWRFAQTLCNGGHLDGEQILGRKTIALMASNHLPMSMLPFVPAGWPYREGYGMGLGVRVMMDPVVADAAGSVGLFTWGGAALTDFWVDQKEQMVGLCMPQYLGSIPGFLQDFRCLAYQALVD